jgi:hypothetical protein
MSSRVYKFETTLNKMGQQNLSVILGEKIFTHPITVSKSGGGLALADARTKIATGGR